MIDSARQNGLLVIFDGKRNDIGSTAVAYAKESWATAKRLAGRRPDRQPLSGRRQSRPFIEVAVRTGRRACSCW